MEGRGKFRLWFDALGSADANVSRHLLECAPRNLWNPSSERPLVTIRLSRAGAKRRPFYHLVVTDSRKPRDSGYLERVGFFNPVATGSEEELRIDQARVRHWLDRGAKLSGRAAQLVRRHARPPTA